MVHNVNRTPIVNIISATVKEHAEPFLKDRIVSLTTIASPIIAEIRIELVEAYSVNQFLIALCNRYRSAMMVYANVQIRVDSLMVNVYAMTTTE